MVCVTQLNGPQKRVSTPSMLKMERNKERGGEQFNPLTLFSLVRRERE